MRKGLWKKTGKTTAPKKRKTVVKTKKKNKKSKFNIRDPENVLWIWKDYLGGLKTSEPLNLGSIDLSTKYQIRQYTKSH